MSNFEYDEPSSEVFDPLYAAQKELRDRMVGANQRPAVVSA